VIKLPFVNAGQMLILDVDERQCLV